MSGPRYAQPRSSGEWRPLDETERLIWLRCSFDRMMAAPPVPRAPVGRTVTLEGSRVDSLVGFYCAVGEAVNGPGGYFGGSFAGLYDCLFGGFGVELPFSFVWKDSARSRGVLGPAALEKFVADERSTAMGSEEWKAEALRGAREGSRTMFAEIVEAFRGVGEPGVRPQIKLQLR